jgi:hypothetical protein
MSKRIREAYAASGVNGNMSFDELYGKDGDALFEGADELIDPRFKKLFESVYDGQGRPHYERLRECGGAACDCDEKSDKKDELDESVYVDDKGDPIRESSDPDLDDFDDDDVDEDQEAFEDDMDSLDDVEDDDDWDDDDIVEIEDGPELGDDEFDDDEFDDDFEDDDDSLVAAKVSDDDDEFSDDAADDFDDDDDEFYDEVGF